MLPTKLPPPTAPAPALARRAVLAATLALVPRPAGAAIGVWDGKSAALGSCPVGADGDGCRTATIAKDLSKGFNVGGASSGSAAPLASGLTTAAKLDGPYASETRALAASIKGYLALAADDPARVPAGRKLRAEGSAWVSKYARGGSARAVSARRFYIAVDAVGGHLAANGAAPFPAAKVPKLLTTIDEAVAQLDMEG